MTSALYVPPGSAGREVAERDSAWLWRLGPVLDAPAGSAIGLGAEADREQLGALVRDGALAGPRCSHPARRPEPDP